MICGGGGSGSAEFTLIARVKGAHILEPKVAGDAESVVLEEPESAEAILNRDDDHALSIGQPRGIEGRPSVKRSAVNLRGSMSSARARSIALAEGLPRRGRASSRCWWCRRGCRCYAGSEKKVSSEFE